MYYIEHLDIGKPVKQVFTHKNRHILAKMQEKMVVA